MLLSEEVVLLNKKCGESSLMGCSVLLIPKIAPCTANTCIQRNYGAHFQIQVGKVVSYPDIDADIPSMQRENFHRKNHTRKASRILRISKSRYFCYCHCPCYRYYCQSLITVHQLTAHSRTVCAVPVLNDHNNKRNER
jgi:hypothetical protein